MTICTASPGRLPAPTTLPMAARPAWVREHGIVMAGNWDPLIARVRRRNGNFEATPDQLSGYASEHTPEMVRRLKALGVNFIMTHGYKGAGFAAEKAGLDDARRLASLAHRAGMHVGAYIFSGTILPEKIRLEYPESAGWEVRDEKDEPVFYTDGTRYRRFMNRNDPAAQAHLKKVVDYAVREVRVDLLHFDNYDVGPGYEPLSVERFRSYLQDRYRPGDFGVPDFASVTPPHSIRSWRPEWKPETPLHRAWIDFSCDSLAQSFDDMAVYARSLRRDILLECNPGPFYRDGAPYDHARLLRFGEAVWHDVVPFAAAKDGVTDNTIRAFKSAQAMNNMAFVYITRPIHAAESLAYNTDCLGCIAWFEWGKIANYPDTENPIDPDVVPYVRFFHAKRPYYREARRVCDVGVVRSFASHAFAPGSAYETSAFAEQRVIETKLTWMPVYDHQWSRLDRFGCVSLIGADCLSARQVAQVGAYLRAGGGIVYTDQTGRFDEKMNPRLANPIDAFAGPRTVKIAGAANAEALRKALLAAMGRRPALDVEGPAHVTTELTEQPELNRRLVHLVNYRNAPATGIRVDVGLPDGSRAKRVVLLRPDSARPLKLPFKQEGDRVVFTVPQIELYSLISVEAGA